MGKKREKEKEWVEDQVGIEEERKAKMEFWNPREYKLKITIFEYFSEILFELFSNPLLHPIH